MSDAGAEPAERLRATRKVATDLTSDFAENQSESDHSQVNWWNTDAGRACAARLWPLLQRGVKSYGADFADRRAESLPVLLRIDLSRIRSAAAEHGLDTKYMSVTRAARELGQSDAGIRKKAAEGQIEGAFRPNGKGPYRIPRRWVKEKRRAQLKDLPYPEPLRFGSTRITGTPPSDPTADKALEAITRRKST